MGDDNNLTWYKALKLWAKEIAVGRHPMAIFIPPLLLLLDAGLCVLIIWKVPCKLSTKGSLELEGI